MTKKQTLKAKIKTNKGEINLNLHDKQTPTTVANFVNLANRGFYNGIVFHRVIDNFMVQAGCPQGMGVGGPGYQFDDEIVDELIHDKPGILSMANAGPGTNGSQFFITHTKTGWLDGKHTVFGAVCSDDDQEIVNSIAQDDVIEAIEIEGDTSALLKEKEVDVAAWNDILDSE